MAITVLGSDSSADGTWQIDYDNVGLTLGHTVTQGTATRLVLRVTEIDTAPGQNQGQPLAGGLDVTRDVTADFGKGRIVDRSNVPNSRVPVHVKGEFYPYTFGGTWIH